MATKTITIGKSMKIEYLTDERLYLVFGTDIETGIEQPMLNLSNDIPEAIAEIGFLGFEKLEFKKLDDLLEELARQYEQD